MHRNTVISAGIDAGIALTIFLMFLSIYAMVHYTHDCRKQGKIPVVGVLQLECINR
jgi:hypothetical protein